MDKLSLNDIIQRIRELEDLIKKLRGGKHSGLSVHSLMHMIFINQEVSKCLFGAGLETCFAKEINTLFRYEQA